MNRKLRVLVAEGAALYRAAVVSALEETGEFAVTAVASGPALATAATVGAADVALVDLDVPPLGAIAALEAMRGVELPPVVVWTAETETDAVVRAFRAGAAGFISKSTSADALIRTLRAVADGEVALPRNLTRLAVDGLRAAQARVSARQRAAALSKRECDVLLLVARGFTNRQISAELSISEFTVKRHVQNILEKLELPSRHEAGSLYLAAYAVGNSALCEAAGS